MAIYHFSGQVIGRGAGRSAVSCAAYRSGEKLYDERQDKILDYSRKQDVIHKEILLPLNAPEWMSNRERLWNEVEKVEIRKDAQLAREFNISLPRELSDAQNLELAREFVKTEFVDKGMVADLCVHKEVAEDGGEQPHAHVMLTMREIVGDGFGMKERSWNAKENLTLWRESWAEHANKYLALNDIDLKIDHRSYRDQGIDLEAQKKIGPDILRIHDARVQEHQEIARQNGQKIYDDPSIALKAITYQQSTFTHRDIARFINRHTIDAEQFQVVYDKVKGSEQIISLGKDNNGAERFSTQDMVALEKTMVEKAGYLEGHLGHRILKQNIENALTNSKLNEEQKAGLKHIIDQGNLKCLVGYAGTGKSTLLKEAKEAWEQAGYNVLGATLSGIAAENLEGASGIASRTFASRSYYWNKGEQHLTKKDILVVDEAGMLGSRQMEQLISEAHKYGAKVVLIGDPQQLQAIEAGAAFRAIIDRAGYVLLTTIVRQNEEWQREATKELANRQTEQAIGRYDEHGKIHVYETQAYAKIALAERWNDKRLEEPEKSQIMLAYTRKEAKELNEMARDFRKENGELKEENQLKTNSGDIAFAVGDRIYFLKNNRDLGVMNGTLGTIEQIKEDKITVKLDKETQNGEARIITVDINNYSHITHGYAATIHKAQGVTVDNSYILASKYMDSHSAYVGMSRHKENTEIFYGKDEFTNQKELIQTLDRYRGKDTTVDYMGRDIEVAENASKNQSRYVEKDRVQVYLDEMRELNKTIDKNQQEYNKSREGYEEALGITRRDNTEQQKPKEPELLIKYKEIEESYLNAKEKGHAYTESVAKDQMERYADKICKDKSSMDYLEKNDQKMHKEMQIHAKELQKQLEKDREIDF